MTAETDRASTRQEGGNHYKDMPIQPAEFCQRNRLNWCEANVVKYVCRHAEKKGAEDIRKAIHYLQLLLEWEYPCDNDRYREIHTPLSPEEVERINKSLNLGSGVWAGVESGTWTLHPDEVDKTGQIVRDGAANCANYDPKTCVDCYHCQSYEREEGEIIAPPHATIEDVAAILADRAAAGVGDDWRNFDRTLTPKQDIHHFQPREQMAQAKESNCQASLDSSQPLDLSLPSIVLECTAEEAASKYFDEWNEANDAEHDLHRAIETWDCLQALQTHLEKGGKMRDAYKGIGSELATHADRDMIMLAKRAMISKNAARWRYAPEVNQIIIETNGEHFTP